MTSSPLTARRAVAATALSCIAVLATACSSATPAAAPSRTAAPAKTVRVTVTATPAAAASPGPTTPAPAAPPACPTRSLQAKVGVSQGTAGSTYTVLDFTNISAAACTLYGYPGVSLAGGKPVSQIGLAAAEGKTPARMLVTLAPGATGNALLQIADARNFPPSRCHLVTATYLQIYPPNQTTPIYLGFTSPACAKPVQLLTISVVQPGSGSSS